MPKKCKCPPVGAPEWVLTYGDMMTLLLTFFIMLVAVSEIKKEDQFRAIVKEVKKAFGMKGGGGRIVTPIDPELSQPTKPLIVKLEQEVKDKKSNAEDPGIDGKQTTVKTVKEGKKFAVGGRITFEPGSAQLSRLGQRELTQVADLIRGYNNVIELRGHATGGELAMGSTYPNLSRLSYARAEAVMDFLVADAIGIKPNRIRLIACADSERVAYRQYTPEQQTPNRRVEILVTEVFVQDLAKAETGGN